MSNAANYATAEADQINFYISTVIPQCKVIQSDMNRQLFGAMDLSFRFQPQKLEIMQALELKKAEQVFKLVGVPVLTFAEGRDLLGYDALTPEQIAEHLSMVKPMPQVTNTRSAPTVDERLFLC